jgi:outer membrane protein assembly factor BamB
MMRCKKIWIPSILLIWIVCSVIAEDAGGWPMFQYDPQHSGHSLSKMPESPRKAWEYEEYGKYGGCFVVSEGNLYVARNFSLSALDIHEGFVLWSIETKGKHILWNHPSVAENKIFTSATEGVLCFDAGTGDIIWNYEVERVDLYSSPLVIDNYVIVGGGNPWETNAKELARRVMCLHAETGELVWEFFARGMVDFSPAYLDGKIYINEGKRIYCLNAETGENVWEKEVEWTSSSSLSLNGKRVFVGTSEGILCLDIETEKILWKFECGDWIFLTPAVAYEKVYAGTSRGIFYCVDARNGDLIWKRETKSVIYSEAVVADGKVAFGTGDGVVYIVDAESGEICESISLDDSGITALVLSDGKLFVGQENGKITCFEESPSKKLILVLMVAVGIMVSVLVWHQRK